VLALKEPNDFGTFSAEVNASLPFTSGALLTAARWALASRSVVAAKRSGLAFGLAGNGVSRRNP